MIYTNNKFQGYWSVPTAAVVEADSKEHAAQILKLELGKVGLGSDVHPDQFEEFKCECVILSTGDY